MDKIKVVFVPRRSKIRPYKMAKALKLIGGFEIHLVCEEIWYDHDLHLEAFDHIHFFLKENIITSNAIYQEMGRRISIKTGFGRMIRIIKDIDPDIIQTFAEPYDHIEHLIKKTNKPIIMSDGADFTGISSGRVSRQEQFCFEHVAGLIYKGPRQVTDYYLERGFNISCRELSWFDHCDADRFEEPHSQGQETHLVYSGNISSDPKVRYCYYIPLAQELAKQKIHFHIYPVRNQYYKATSYHQLAQKEPYFHFHPSISYAELVKELPKYDWGLWIHHADPSHRTKPAKMNTGIGNKLFTYLEAGLPVIISSSRKFGIKQLEKYKFGFAIDDHQWGQIKELIQRQKRDKLIENLCIAREKLSLKNNAELLSNFYKALINA